MISLFVAFWDVFNRDQPNLSTPKKFLVIVESNFFWARFQASSFHFFRTKKVFFSKKSRHTKKFSKPVRCKKKYLPLPQNCVRWKNAKKIKPSFFYLRFASSLSVAKFLTTMLIFEYLWETFPCLALLDTKLRWTCVLEADGNSAII